MQVHHTPASAPPLYLTYLPGPHFLRQRLQVAPLQPLVLADVNNTALKGAGVDLATDGAEEEVALRW